MVIPTLQEVAEILCSNRSISPSGCWEWIKGKNKSGYGFTYIRGKQFKVARLSAFLYHGLDLNNPKINVNHKTSCNNKNCFNPNHIYKGTQKENLLDIISNGRAKTGPIPNTHCRKGHEILGYNAKIVHGGYKICRLCDNENQIRLRKARKTKQNQLT